MTSSNNMDKYKEDDDDELWGMDDDDEEQLTKPSIPMLVEEENLDDSWSSAEEEESPKLLADNKYIELIKEQRALYDSNKGNSLEDNIQEEESNISPIVTTERNEVTPPKPNNAEKILQTYQTLINRDDLNEELIQQKSSSTKRLIHPNKIFNFAITIVCTLFGIICGVIISQFSIHSIGFISVIIIMSILLIGLGLWFGASETVEERVTVTQVRLPINSLLSKKAITFWKSSECQTLAHPQDNTSKSYINKEARERFADKEEDEIFDADITISKQLRQDHKIDEDLDFGDDFSDSSMESNDMDSHPENSDINNQQLKPKPLFVDISNNSRSGKPIGKVKRNGEKDYLYFGACIPSYRNGKWIPPYSDDFETFKQQFTSSNITLRDDLVGQRNSILPNIRLKNDDDYRSSKTFTEIEMENIKNNVSQHREELYNFGVDNTCYEPVIAPSKIKDLCKTRKLILKFE